MADQGLTWRDGSTFLELYFGAGMHSLWSSSTNARWERRSVKPPRSPSTRTSPEAEEQVSYIPAQRVTGLRDGWTRPFGEYQAGDPYALRTQRFHEALRDVVHRHVLGGWELHVDADALQERFVI